MFLLRGRDAYRFSSIIETEGQEQLVCIIKTIKVLNDRCRSNSKCCQTSDIRMYDTFKMSNEFALQSIDVVFFAIEIETNERYIGNYEIV